MKYYTFKSSKYLSATAHLEPMEDLAYRRLLDLFYEQETPLVADISRLARLIRMRGYEAEIESVLNEFWVIQDGGYVEENAVEELNRIYDKSYKAREAARKRWEKRKVENSVETVANLVANEVSGIVDACDSDGVVCVLEDDALAGGVETRGVEVAGGGDVDGIPERFPMFIGWKPVNVSHLDGLLRHSMLEPRGSDFYNVALNNFIAYYSGRPEIEDGDMGWIAKLIKWIQREKQQNHKGVALSRQSGGAVSVSVSNKSKTMAALESVELLKKQRADGVLRGCMPNEIFFELCSGIQKCLMANLGHRPSADTVNGFVMTVEQALSQDTAWDSELDKGRIGRAVDKFLADNPDNRFVTVDDLNKHMPRRKKAAVQLENKRTPEQIEHSRMVGRENVGKLKNVLKAGKKGGEGV